MNVRDRLINVNVVAPIRVLLAGMLIALGAIIGFAPGTASACSCAPMTPIVVAVDAAHSPDAGATSTVTTEPPRNDSRVRSGPGFARGVIATLVLLGVFVGGLRRIRAQRRSGRTSKFPRIG